MQAVILAAGKSTRTYPLTLTRPKPLIPLANTPLLLHNLEQLQGIVDEVIVIVGFKRNMIQEAVEKENYNFTVRYIEQDHQLGTGHALEQAEPHLQGRFLVFGGDDLFHRNDITSCLKHDCSLLVSEHRDSSRFGVVVQKDGLLQNIQEKPGNSRHSLVNTGLYLLHKNIFTIGKEKSSRGEYELTDLVTAFARQKPISCVRVKKYWLPIGYPGDILAANAFLLSRQNPPVITGKGTHINSDIRGPIIIGDHCSVGSGCSIQETSIGDHCTIGDHVRITNSVLLEHTTIESHTSLHNVITGQGVFIGEGTITEKNKGFGCVIGDGAQIGKKTSISPGRRIYPFKKTRPGERVEEDIL